MTLLLDVLSRSVTTRPIVTLVVLVLITVGVGAGITRLAPQADSTVFLPEESRVAAASSKVQSLFGGTRDTTTVTLIFRGNALTPDGLSQMDAALAQVTSDPKVAPLLALPDPVFAPTMLVAAALGTNDFASLSQQEIDQAATRIPVGRLVGTDSDGTPVATASVRLVIDADRDGDVDDDAGALAEAELAIHDIVKASRGPLEGSSLSGAVVAEDTSAGTGSQMVLLMILALTVIAALLLVFTRSLLDLMLSLLGLVLTIVWMMGLQGWLGPNGIGVIGAPNTLTTMVPIMLIGLVIDYAIQTVGTYREQRSGGNDVRTSARLGLRAVIIPLSLAAVTTIVSFLTNLTSPIPANGDFGVVAGVGVAVGLVVMLVMLASARTLVDRWRERRGSLPAARPHLRSYSGCRPRRGGAGEPTCSQTGPVSAGFRGRHHPAGGSHPLDWRPPSTPTTSCRPAATRSGTSRRWTRPSAAPPTW